jgi:hypothetical protein
VEGQGEAAVEGDARTWNVDPARAGSFTGLQGLHLSHADLLDSQDLEQEDSTGFVGGPSQVVRVGDRAKDLSAAERYHRTITS